MARLRYNGLAGALGASLSDSATSVTFAAKLTHAGGDVPTITGTDYIPLSLLDSDGLCAEIVHLTAYTAEATSGTIARGKESTAGVAHDNGAAFSNSGLVNDASPFRPTLYYAQGSGSGTNYETTSTTFVDIDATNLAITVPAAVDDVVLVEFTGNIWGNSSIYLTTQVVSNGVPILDSVAHTTGDFIPRHVAMRHAVLVTSEMLSGGNMPIKVQWKTSAHTMNLGNSASNRGVLSALVVS
jgi:hypothetical protein